MSANWVSRLQIFWRCSNSSSRFKDKPENQCSCLPKCATRKLERSGTCPHGWWATLSIFFISLGLYGWCVYWCVFSFSYFFFNWMGKLLNEIVCKMNFVSVTQHNDTIDCIPVLSLCVCVCFEKKKKKWKTTCMCACVHVSLWQYKANKNWQFVEINSWWLNQNI